MTYTVELSVRAEADVEETYNYIREHGPADPDDWKSGLDEKLTSLERSPDWCGFAPENDSARAEVRQLLYGPFRILFTIRENRVYVITVRHGARRFLRPDEIDQP